MQRPLHAAASGRVYDALRTNGGLKGAVMWHEWRGGGPLNNSVLTSPIQKAHIYTHARQKDTLKSSIQIQFNSFQEQKDLG